MATDRASATRTGSYRPACNRLLDVAASVGQVFVPTAAQENAFAQLCDYTDLAAASGASTGLVLAGDSGAGKTSTMKRWQVWAEQTYPDRKVLLVGAEGDPTSKSITESILNAADDPFSHIGTYKAKLKRLTMLVESGRVLAIAFDEFQHFLTGNSAAKVRKAAEFIKDLFNRLGIPIFIAGLPSLVQFTRSSQELENRFTLILTLRTCDVSNPGELREFRTVLGAYSKLVPLDDGLSLESELMLVRFMIATSGSLKLIAAILQQACLLAGRRGASAVGLPDLSRSLLNLSEGKQGVIDVFSMDEEKLREKLAHQIARMRTARER